MRNKLVVSSPPHLHKGESISKIMWMVVVSLIPAGAAGVFIFGLPAFWTVVWAVVAAMLAEAVLQALSKKKVTITDGSAIVTGLLLAYNLPPQVPFWLPVVGSFFAIAIGKHVFGGLGQNIFNPALAGRVFLMASWPKYMTDFARPMDYNVITSATPLTLIREGRVLENISYLDLFLGKKGGCIGEACILALLLGAGFLFFRGYISWHIPLSYIATTGLLVYIFGPQGFFSGDWLFHILSGGLVLGAFFMATDYATSPLTRRGQLVFGMGCGLLTTIIRLKGGYPEGASYAILIMNAVVPLIDRYMRPRIYGTK